MVNKMENMIYLNIKGGLGNMLFQIAAATSMGLDKNLPVSFPNLEDYLKFRNDEQYNNPKLNHAFEYKKLSPFHNMITTAPPRDIVNFEYPFEYTPKQPNHKDFMIGGYFQSEKYFKNNIEYITNMFSATPEIDSYITAKYPWMNENGLTSIHIRRGDSFKNLDCHPVLTPDYYARAMEYTREMTKKYVVFSDDIDWCKSHFLGDSFVFIEDEKDYYEIYMMARCQNNIIANSSFSWWGAWLNQNPDKLVIATSKEPWFGPGLGYLDTSDLVPAAWKKI